MHVYSTPEFKEQVKKHEQLVFKVKRLSRELETMAANAVQARFERLYPYLKRKEGNFRLIARIYQVGQEQVLCWLIVFARGDREYNIFLRDREDYLDRHLKPDVFKNLSQWLKNRQIKHQQRLQKNSIPLPLPKRLRIWLQRPSWEMDLDRSIIYECNTWVTNFRQPAIRSQARAYHEIIEQLINYFGKLGRSTKWSPIKLYGDGKRYLLYSPITTIDDPPRQILLLIAPFSHLPSDRDLDKIVESLNFPESDLNCWQNPDFLTVDNLISIAKRAYPSYLLAEYHFWLAIEDGNGVNLALSTEEKAILHSVSTQESLPLFLNGRAGSGKSTMLFYLFTDYCDRYLQSRSSESELLTKPHPLFLTYNQKLSNLAKDKVQSLLKYNYRFLAQNELQSVPDLSSLFQSFRPFLISLLPPEKKVEFQAENYVSFHHFRQLCNWGGRKYAPEKSWQVIRTFIKGYSLDDNFTNSIIYHYRHLPKKEKTVSESEFEKIYHGVWQWYADYTQRHQLWDDQDLIRTVLAERYYRSQYTAIFCDEAQDFTRLELQLILRLSVLSNYSLEREQITSLPFAFAGDPLQTLNPTGFRWESLKAAFHNEILTALTPATKPTMKMNFKELQYNYRSVAPIVGLNNLIQLWRKLLFSLTTIKPQQTRKPSNFIPQKFILDRQSNYNLINILQKTLIIIPCDEGGEAEFIRQDEILSQLATENASEIPWNILSAIAAKGLEFKQVVLYKFGESCPPDLWQIKPEATSAEKYFLNKLYVAASRATEKLFIVDSTQGEYYLWSKASDRGCLTEFLVKIPLEEREQWQQNIQLVSLGQYPEQMNSDDTEAIATIFAEEGIKTANPELLQRARAAYNRLGDTAKAACCWAWQLAFEQQFLAAAKQFLSLNDLSQARYYFWQALAWQELLELELNTTIQSNRSTQPQNIKGEPTEWDRVFPLIKFMVNKSAKVNQQQINNVIEFTAFLWQEIALYRDRIYPYSKQWQAGIKAYTEQIQQIIERSHLAIATSEWEKIGTLLASFIDRSHCAIGKIAGECFYRAKNYRQAVSCWEKLESINFQNYYLAKAKMTGLPAGLHYLAEAEANTTIIRQWLKADRNRDRVWLEFVAPALEKIDFVEHAFLVYCHLDNLSQVQACWQKIARNSISLNRLRQLLQYYLKNQHWQEAIDGIETYLIPQFKQTNLKYQILQQISNSQLTPAAIALGERQRYLEFIRQEILCDPQWRSHLTVPQVGVALEKIGFLVATLAFYETYTEAANSQIKEFVRHRWLATKQKQVAYCNFQGQTHKAQKHQRELISHARCWQIATATISSLPSIPARVTRPQYSSEIRGLPAKIPIQTPELNIQQFDLHHLTVKIMAATQQVVIIDRFSDRQIIFDTRSHQIRIDTAILSNTSNQSLTYSEVRGSYSVTLENHPYSSVELDFHQSQAKIAIQFMIQ